MAALASCAPRGAVVDVAPESRDVVVHENSGYAPHSGRDSAGGYEYVARRPLAIVALAEGRGLSAPVAHAAVDRLADALEGCLQARDPSGNPPLSRLRPGAARVVAAINPSGAVEDVAVRVDKAAGAAETALLCLVSPLRLLPFPAGGGVGRGIAIEALWGQDAAGAHAGETDAPPAN